MRLTREQILRMAQAVRNHDSDAEVFYVEQQSDGKLRFGAVEVVEKQRPIPLSKSYEK